MRTHQPVGRPYDPSRDGWSAHIRRHVKTIPRTLADQEMLAADQGETFDELSDADIQEIEELGSRFAERTYRRN